MGKIIIGLVWTIALFTGIILYVSDVRKDNASKVEAIKACNRKGAIYSEGACQHVFAPICRRL